MQTDDTIHVAIVEDDRTTRDGLSLIVNGTPGYRCVGAFSSVEEALRLIGRELPDVLLLDIHLPGMAGSEGVRIIKERHPSVQVLMLTVYDEEDIVFESICNGACGYLLKKTPPAKLLEAVAEVHHGGSPMSPEIARKVVTLFQKTGAPEKLDHSLSPQEVRLLGLLAKGYSYQMVADRLGISINTVRTYIKDIYDKLHVHSKSEAVSKALKARII
jgi:DNA-binding NarL/FixJ family response regulator